MVEKRLFNVEKRLFNVEKRLFNSAKDVDSIRVFLQNRVRPQGIVEVVQDKPVVTDEVEVKLIKRRLSLVCSNLIVFKWNISEPIKFVFMAFKSCALFPYNYLETYKVTSTKPKQQFQNKL
jgi:hypothetical protein